MKAVSAVLTFESMMALMACLNPSSTAVRTSFPCCSSSRMRSKISTFASTAMPTDNTRPASPGNVRVNPNPARPASVKTTYRVYAEDLFSGGPSLALKAPPAAPRQPEVHDRLIRERVARGLRILEVFPRDDRAVLPGVQRAVAAAGARQHLGTPLELQPARDEQIGRASCRERV